MNDLPGLLFPLLLIRVAENETVRFETKVKDIFQFSPSLFASRK